MGDARQTVACLWKSDALVYNLEVACKGLEEDPVLAKVVAWASRDAKQYVKEEKELSNLKAQAMIMKYGKLAMIELLLVIDS